MQEIVSYLKEQYNKALMDQMKLTDMIHILENKINNIVNREISHSIKEDNSDFVFQVHTFENILEDEALVSLKERKDKLEEELRNLKDNLKDVDGVVNRLRTLYEKAHTYEISSKQNETCKTKLEFIIQLMDNDVQRAKLELVSFLKEDL